MLHCEKRTKLNERSESAAEYLETTFLGTVAFQSSLDAVKSAFMTSASVGSLASVLADFWSYSSW